MRASDTGNMSRVGITVALSFIFTIIWAMACNLLLETMQVLDEPSRLLVYTLRPAKLLIFLLNSAVLWVVLIFFVAATGRFWISVSSLFTGAALIGYANHLKLGHRQEPLFPSDLHFALQPEFLSDMIGKLTLLSLAVGCLVSAAILAIAGARLTKRRYPPPHRNLSRNSLRLLVAARTLTVLLTSAMLVYAAHFNSTGNLLRATYEISGARWAWWYQPLNYYRNGTIGGFLYNTNVPAMSAPDGYSRRRMEVIADRYSEMARNTNTTRDPDALKGINVVVVLSEAFSDPLRISGASFAEDPIPFTRRLMTETDSGIMLAQMIGGGTANMEFEVLTGLSLALFEPQMNSPFQMLIPETDTFPSAVGHLRLHGHDPIAVHPYMTSMYQRETVYPKLGIRDFVGEAQMGETEKIENGDFVSDASAYREVLHRIGSSRSPLLVNLVTMQNHFPTDESYSDPIPVSGLKKELAKHASGYARGLRHSDTALQDFLRELETEDERTAVIFYGDHLPGFWPSSFNERNGLAMRQTPFFIWTNYRDVPNQERPVTSPTHFIPMLYEDLNAAVPPFYALLDKVRAHVPAMQHGVMLGPDGRELAPDDLSREAQRVLRDYRLVQYDLSVGARHSLDAMFPQASPDMTTQVR